MPSIVGKKQGNKTYYYLVESARVGGKPRIVSQRYLGPAEEIIARLSETGPGEPDRTRHLGFGDLAAVWAMLERLNVAHIVDDVVGARRGDAAASVGTYIALATANRVVDPRSKRAFSDWWDKTAGDRFVRLPAGGDDRSTSGTPWMRSARPNWPRSNGVSSPPWWTPSVSTCRAWCST